MHRRNDERPRRGAPRASAPCLGWLLYVLAAAPWVPAQIYPADAKKGAGEARPAGSPSAAAARFSTPTLHKPETPGDKIALLVRVHHDNTRREMVDSRTAYLLKRAMVRANEGDVAAVIIDIDTPGGLVAAAFECRDAIFGMEPVTNCLVRRAISAGSLLMLSCDNIFVAPGASLGDATTIQISPVTGVVPPANEGIEDKMITATRTEFEATAEAKGHRTDIARAFSDRREEIPGLSMKGRVLELTGKQAIAERLAISELQNPGDVLIQLGMEGSRMEEFELTSQENFAAFVQSWSWLFLSLGVLGLFFEFKTPGFGLPGALGLLCLIVFFWANHVGLTASWFEIALFAIGIGLLVAEVAFIPGFGVAGILGIVCVTLSVFLSMVDLPNTLGGPNWTLIVRNVSGPLLHVAVTMVVFIGLSVAFLRYLPDTPLWKRIALQTAMTQEEGYVGVAVQDEWVGKEGTARTTLRPAGTIEIGRKRLDAMTQGEYIEKGTRVRVLSADSAQVIVEAVEDEPPPPHLNILDS